MQGWNLRFDMAETGHRLLLIESEPLLAEVTAYRLELLGYVVETVESQVQIWAAIDRLKPHAVILNIETEAVRPLELLEQFTSDTETAEIPILALSSHAELDQVERVWKNGARDYLVVPYDPVVLGQKVARLLDGIDPLSVPEEDPEAEEPADLDTPELAVTLS
jgi:DNA-binding response OmpR family regulator